MSDLPIKTRVRNVEVKLNGLVAAVLDLSKEIQELRGDKPATEVKPPKAKPKDGE